MGQGANIRTGDEHCVKGQILGQGLNIGLEVKHWIRWQILGLGQTLGQGANIGSGSKHWVGGQTLGWRANIGQGGAVKHWVRGQTLILNYTSRWSQPIESYEKALIANRLACSKEKLWQLNEKAAYPDT